MEGLTQGCTMCWSDTRRSGQTVGPRAGLTPVGQGGLWGLQLASTLPNLTAHRPLGAAVRESQTLVFEGTCSLKHLGKKEWGRVCT